MGFHAWYESVRRIIKGFNTFEAENSTEGRLEIQRIRGYLLLDSEACIGHASFKRLVIEVDNLSGISNAVGQAE